MALRAGMTPEKLTDAERMESVLENAYVLVHEKKISNMKDMLPGLFQGRTKKRRMRVPEALEALARAASD